MSDAELRSELEALHPQAFAWAVRCCRGDRGVAEDVLHAAYLKVLEGRARFDGGSSFRTWFFGVVRFTEREQRRRGWVRLLLLERWWRDQGPEPEVVAEDERVTRLRGALERLSQRQAQVLHLVFYQTMTIQEAADVLQMPVGTARTHYERGKARLRSLLDAGGES